MSKPITIMTANEMLSLLENVFGVVAGVNRFELHITSKQARLIRHCLEDLDVVDDKDLTQAITGPLGELRPKNLIGNLVITGVQGNLCEIHYTRYADAEFARPFLTFLNNLGAANANRNLE